MTLQHESHPSGNVIGSRSESWERMEEGRHYQRHRPVGAAPPKSRMLQRRAKSALQLRYGAKLKPVQTSQAGPNGLVHTASFGGSTEILSPSALSASIHIDAEPSTPTATPDDLNDNTSHARKPSKHHQSKPQSWRHPRRWEGKPSKLLSALGGFLPVLLTE